LKDYILRIRTVEHGIIKWPLMNSRLYSLSIIATIIGALAVGLSPIFVRVSDLGPEASAFYRAFLAIPVLWVWRLADLKNPMATRVKFSDQLLLAVPGLLFAGDLAFWHASIKLTSVANATLLANFAPIFVTIGGYLLFRERVTKIFVVGMVMTIIGAGFLVGNSFAYSASSVLGDGFGLITGMFFAAYILAIGRLRVKFSTAALMFWGTIWTALFLFPVALFGADNLVPLSMIGWAVLIALAWVSHVLGQGLIAYALAHLPAQFSSVTIVLEAVFAVAFGWIILAEKLEIVQWIGIVVVLTGIFVAQKASRR